MPPPVSQHPRPGAEVIDDAIAELEKNKKKAKAKKVKEEAAPKSKFQNLKSKTAERLFVEKDHIFFYRDGKIIEKPDGHEERAIHVIGALGPRSALKRYDYVVEPEMKFHIRYLNDGLITLDLIDVFLEYAGWNGLGSDRSQGEGRFELVNISARKP